MKIIVKKNGILPNKNDDIYIQFIILKIIIIINQLMIYLLLIQIILLIKILHIKLNVYKKIINALGYLDINIKHIYINMLIYVIKMIIFYFMLKIQI